MVVVLVSLAPSACVNIDKRGTRGKVKADDNESDGSGSGDEGRSGDSGGHRRNLGGVGGKKDDIVKIRGGGVG